MIPIDVDYFA
ncbi:hypothetical protein SS209_01070 [Salmonella enterica subsp. enterica serovar Senftenberg str. SS209]|nr:hypothetical protein SS209_01070 [Salmonella enterica subsp. enterica serovar Senftenberg str. SS209]